MNIFTDIVSAYLYNMTGDVTCSENALEPYVFFVLQYVMILSFTS